MHSSRDFLGCGEPLAGLLDADYGRALGRQTQVASRTRMARLPRCVVRRKRMPICVMFTLFVPPAKCKVVEGYVAITGCCNAFDLVD